MRIRPVGAHALLLDCRLADSAGAPEAALVERGAPSCGGVGERVN